MSLSDKNDRFAKYVQRTRCLEIENESLVRKANETKVVNEKKLREQTALQQKTISAIGTSIAEVDDRRTRTQSNYEVTVAESLALQTKMDSMTANLEKMKQLKLGDKRDIKRLGEQVATLYRKRCELRKNVEDKKADVIAVKRECEVTRNCLDKTLSKNNLISRQLTTLKSDIDLLKKTHNENVDKATRQYKEKIENMKLCMLKDREQRLRQGLQERQAELDARLATSAKRIKRTHQTRLVAARDDLHSIVRVPEHEPDFLRRDLATLEDEMQRGNEVVCDLRKRVAELDSRLLLARADERTRLEQRESAIRNLEKKLCDIRMHNEHLETANEYFTAELQSYQQMLDDEMLNISEMSACNTGYSPRDSGCGQDRITCQPWHKESGEIRIDSRDVNGRFIRLTNTGSRTVSIGGSSLICTNGDKPIVYKFEKRQNIGPGDHITVWSAGECDDDVHSGDIFMKTLRWLKGHSVSVRLINANGQLVFVHDDKDGSLLKERAISQINI